MAIGALEGSIDYIQPFWGIVHDKRKVVKGTKMPQNVDLYLKFFNKVQPWILQNLTNAVLISIFMNDK